MPLTGNLQRLVLAVFQFLLEGHQYHIALIFQAKLTLLLKAFLIFTILTKMLLEEQLCLVLHIFLPFCEQFLTT